MSADQSDSSIETMTPLAAKYREDVEWFNQRLANARIHNSELEREIARYRIALREICYLEPGSRGAFGKFKDAQAIAAKALIRTSKPKVDQPGE